MLLVTHSMGSIMSIYFLNQQTQAWKDKHVRSLVSIAGVGSGRLCVYFDQMQLNRCNLYAIQISDVHFLHIV